MNKEGHELFARCISTFFSFETFPVVLVGGDRILRDDASFEREESKYSDE